MLFTHKKLNGHSEESMADVGIIDTPDNAYEGTVMLHPRGFGFLDVDNVQYFIPPIHARSVLPGDVVVASPCDDSVETNERVPVKPIALRSSPYLNRPMLGYVQRTIEGKPYVHTFEPSLASRRFYLDPNRSLHLNEGDVIEFSVVAHPIENNGLAVTRVHRGIGHVCQDRMPWTYARYVHLNDMRRRRPMNIWVDYNQPEQELAKGEAVDWTHLPFFTLDAMSVRDMDDAICIAPRAAGGYDLWVAIAQPVAHIEWDTPVSRIARECMETLYYPAEKDALLPLNVTEQVGSLWPERIRQAIGCHMQITQEGALVDYDVQSVAIRSRAKLDYESVATTLDTDSLHPDAPEDVQTQFAHWSDFLELRKAWRMEHNCVLAHSIDWGFDIDPDTFAIRQIRCFKSNSAHGIVEEAMLLNNESVTHWVQENGGEDALIYITHDGFRDRSVDSVCRQLTKWNIVCGRSRLQTLEGFCDVMRMLSPKQQQLLTGKMNSSSISQAPQPHFGLGLREYATFSSPLRKYIDLHNQYVVKALLAGEPTDAFKLSEHELRSMTKRRKAIKDSYRTLRKWLYERYFNNSEMRSRTFKAQVSAMYKRHLILECLETGARFKTKCHNKGILQLDDTVSVQVRSVDPITKDIWVDIASYVIPD